MPNQTSSTAPARPLLDSDDRMTGVGRWSRAAYGPLFTARLWREALHLVTDLVVGIVAFTWAVTMLSLSAGLLITLIGIPLLAFTVVSGRAIGAFERGRAQILLDTTLVAPAPLPPADGFGGWVSSRLRDNAGWMGLGYGVLLLPWAMVTFTMVVAVWSISFSLVTAPLYQWSLPEGAYDWILGGLGMDATNWWGYTILSVVFVFLGLIALPIAARVTFGLAEIDRRLISTMLSADQTAVLTERIDTLTRSRDASVGSAASELRRIERDLHDGAQQRLVDLAMHLGLAKERLDGADPETAVLVERAHDDAKRAIAELRDLVRGIHPSVLADRGLDAAVSALAARSPIPVIIEPSLPRRLPTPVETAAYFAVAEALTNAAKHSAATRVVVRLVEDPTTGTLRVMVHDDGRGGALIGPTGGLRGLVDRLAAVEGRLSVSSPDGGPTTLVAEIPCGS